VDTCTSVPRLFDFECKISTIPAVRQKNDEMGMVCNTKQKEEKCIQSFEDLDIGPIYEDNITMDLRGTAWEGVGWIHLAQDTERW
jgi:hypothetical protein